MKNKKGYLSFVLHTHLPYLLSHGTWPHGVEWLNEASAECYIPLLKTFSALKDKRTEYPLLTLGLTPVLQEQLRDKRFKESFNNYLLQKINSAKEDELFFDKTNDPKQKTAKYWYNYYSEIKRIFEEDYNKDLLEGFAKLQDEGAIEIITCCATHGYLPLLGTDNSVNAQIAIGRDTYKRNLKTDPKGIWLPECAYRPKYHWKYPTGSYGSIDRRGVEEYLSYNGIRYFIIDTALLKGGKSMGVYIDRFQALKQLWKQFEKSYKVPNIKERNPYMPYIVESQNGNRTISDEIVSIFTRDEKTGLQVWSGEWGYPGNPVYLDFHKKHFPGGHRYWRVTDAKIDLALKEEYDLELIDRIVNQQADHFTSLAYSILSDNFENNKFPGIITAPYDTELLGHWWFEGPKWLKRVLEILTESTDIGHISCGEYMKKYPPYRVVDIPEGSWGEGNFHYIWFNEWTKWTWDHIYRLEHQMVKWANKLTETNFTPDDNFMRILRQAGRELLLLESSDWQFLISTWSARDYAEQRFTNHCESASLLFRFLDEYYQKGELGDGAWAKITYLEERDNLFPDLDPSYWSDKKARVLQSITTI